MSSRAVGWVRRRLAATRQVWRPGDRHMAVLPHPLEPKPKSVTLPGGHLDLPFADSEVGHEPVLVRGWAMFPSGPPAKVEVWFGDEHMGAARLGLSRPDLEIASGLGSGMVSQFEHVVDLRHWPDERRDASVRVVATSVDGERFELRPVRVRVTSSRDRSEPIAVARPPAVALPRTQPAVTGERLRLVAFTHQLDLGGAQLLLLDLLRGMQEDGRLDLTVVSPLDGPLRESLEELDIPVHLSSPFPLDQPKWFASRVEELAAWAAHGRFDVALVNTMLAFPGGAAASRLGIPAVWAIHESYDPSMLWWLFGPSLRQEVRQTADAALASAAGGLFEADATASQYEPVLGADRCVSLPYGIDLTALDSAREGFDRDAARRRRRIAADEQLVLCVGTIEPRKAQVPLTQAFSLIADRHPRARLVFIGGRDDDETRLLKRYAARCGPPGRVTVLPIQRDVWSWYGISDLLVCSSDVESLPRSVLEAMAWETPVLATAVFGLPELIDHEETGWLCPPRDVRALADALDAVLSTPQEERSRIGAAGRELVERRHALAPYASAVADLLIDVAAGRPLAAAHARAE